MKNFLVTVAGGVAVGLILRRVQQPAPMGTKAQDYAGTDFEAWAKAQG